MNDKRIFGTSEVPFSLPWKFIVITAIWETVVSDTYNTVFRAYDRRAYLRIGVFASLCAQMRKPHKVFIPAQYIVTFHLTIPFSYIH